MFNIGHKLNIDEKAKADIQDVMRKAVQGAVEATVEGLTKNADGLTSGVTMLSEQVVDAVIDSAKNRIVERTAGAQSVVKLVGKIAAGSAAIWLAIVVRRKLQKRISPNSMRLLDAASIASLVGAAAYMGRGLLVKYDVGWDQIKDSLEKIITLPSKMFSTDHEEDSDVDTVVYDLKEEDDAYLSGSDDECPGTADNTYRRRVVTEAKLRPFSDDLELIKTIASVIVGLISSDMLSKKSKDQKGSLFNRMLKAIPSIFAAKTTLDFGVDLLLRLIEKSIVTFCEWSGNNNWLEALTLFGAPSKLVEWNKDISRVYDVITLGERAPTDQEIQMVQRISLEYTDMMSSTEFKSTAKQNVVLLRHFGATLMAVKNALASYPGGNGNRFHHTNMYLFGAPGTGKTSLGRGIAELMAFEAYCRNKAIEMGIDFTWEDNRIVFDSDEDRNRFREIVQNAPLAVGPNGVLTLNYSAPRMDPWRPNIHLSIFVDDAFCMKDTEGGEHVGKFILLLNQAAFCPEVPDLPRKGTFMTADCSVLTSNMPDLSSLKSLQSTGAMGRRLQNAFLVFPKVAARGELTGDRRRHWEYKLNPNSGIRDPWVMVLCDPMNGQPILKEEYQEASVAARMNMASVEQQEMIRTINTYSGELPSDDPKCPYKTVFHTRDQVYAYTRFQMYANWRKTMQMNVINDEAMDTVRAGLLDAIQGPAGIVVPETTPIRPVRPEGSFSKPMDLHASTMLANMRTDLYLFISQYGHHATRNSVNPTMPRLYAKKSFDDDKDRAKQAWAVVAYEYLDRTPHHPDSEGYHPNDATPLVEAYGLMAAMLACRHSSLSETWYAALSSHVQGAYVFISTHWQFPQLEAIQRRYTLKCSSVMEGATLERMGLIDRIGNSLRDLKQAAKRTWDSMGVVESLKMVTAAMAALAAVYTAGRGAAALVDKFLSGDEVTAQAYSLPKGSKSRSRNHRARTRAAQRVKLKPSERHEVTLESGLDSGDPISRPIHVPDGFKHSSVQSNKVVDNTVLFTALNERGVAFTIGHGLGIRGNTVIIPVHMLKSGYLDDDLLTVSYKSHVFSIKYSTLRDQVWDQTIFDDRVQTRDYCLWQAPSGPRFSDLTKNFLHKGSLSKMLDTQKVMVNAVTMRPVKSGLAPMLATRSVLNYDDKDLSFIGGDGSTKFCIAPHILTGGPTCSGDSGSPIWIQNARGVFAIGIHTGKLQGKDLSVESILSLEDVELMLDRGRLEHRFIPECAPKADLVNYKHPLRDVADIEGFDTVRKLTLLEQSLEEFESEADFAKFKLWKEEIVPTLGELSDIRLWPDFRLGEPVAMAAKNNAMTATSSQEKSELYGAIPGEQPNLVASEMTYSACVEKVLRGSAIRDNPKTAVHQKLMAQADLNMVHQYRNLYGSMGLLTFEEAVTGVVDDVRILQPMARNTSAGMAEAYIGHHDKTSWMGREGPIDTTSKAFLQKKAEVLGIIDDIVSGQHPITVIKPSPKDEMLPAEKLGSCRVIYATDDAFVIIVRMYYGWFIHHTMGDHMFDNNSAVGINPATDGLHFLKSLAKGTKHIDKGFFSLDVSKYDASQTYEFIKANFDTADQCYPDRTEDEIKVRKWISDMSAAPHIWVGRWVYRRWGGWISGHPLTTIFNNMSWRRALLMTLPFIMDNPDGEPLVIDTLRHPLIWCEGAARNFNNIAFGDDNVIYWPDACCEGEPVTTATFKRALKEHVGWNITNADKTDPYERPDPSSSWRDISFLKRSFISHSRRLYLHDSTPHVYMALDLDSIRKSVNYTTDSSNIKDLEQVVDSALNQISYHGIEVWEELAPGLIETSVKVLHYYPRNADFMTALWAERR